MKNSEVLNWQAEGIYKITSAYPEKNNHRINRLVCFPFELEVGKTAIWIYVKDRGDEEFGGANCRTSLVKSIEMELGQLQVSTENSQYVFERIL